MLVAVNFRDEQGFAVFSIQQTGRSRVGALGHVPANVALHAVVRIGAVWVEYVKYCWQVRANTADLIDEVYWSGVVAFLTAWARRRPSGRSFSSLTSGGHRHGAPAA